MKLLTTCMAVLTLAACTQMPIEPPPGDHPVQAVNPVSGAPLALAWHRDESLTMVLDTGAAQESLLFSPAVAAHGYRIRGKGPMRTTGMDISLIKGQPPLAERQDVVMVTEAPYDGIIGWKTIRRHVWNLNYPAARQHFYTTLPPRVRRWDKLRLMPGSDFAQIRASRGRRVIIDTGAPHALYIAKKHWDHFKLEYPDATVSVYSGFSPAAGGYYALECMRIKSFRIGDLELRNIVACQSFADKDVMNIDGEIDMLLGIGAFYGREFWLDGPGNALYFSSRRPNSSPMPAFNSVGAAFIPRQNGAPPYVARVAQWSEAWESGLRDGDVLVSLNGRKHPSQALIDYVTTQTGAEARLKVRRKGKLIDIEWTVPEMPEPGDYHPTPEAVTQETFEELQRNQEQEARENALREAEQAAPPNSSPNN